MSFNQKTVLTEVEAAAYLGLHPTTLRKARMEGRRAKRCPTPSYVRLGRAIRYRVADLEQFLEEHRVATHTAKTPVADNNRSRK